MTLDELENLRRMFPTMRYLPNPHCPHCAGTGVDTAATKRAETIQYAAKGPRPCACIFFSPDWVEPMRQAIGEYALKTLEEMKEHTP